VIDFKNTVVIMTSNLGARDIGKGKGLGFHPSEQSQFEVMEEKVNEEINRAFNPEFINRLDDIIVFHPLSREQIGQIVHNLLKDVQKRLRRSELTLKLTDEAVDFLIEHGYDEKFGARPIRARSSGTWRIRSRRRSSSRSSRPATRSRSGWRRIGSRCPSGSLFIEDLRHACSRFNRRRAAASAALLMAVCAGRGSPPARSRAGSPPPPLRGHGAVPAGFWWTRSLVRGNQRVDEGVRGSAACSPAFPSVTAWTSRRDPPADGHRQLRGRGGVRPRVGGGWRRADHRGHGAPV
jgi:hypothetical protein